MSNNRNITDAELDTMFKNADSATPVPAFEDAFWTEMEAMLPEKKRKGVILFWWMSGAAVITLVFVLLGMHYFGSKEQAGEARKSSLKDKIDVSVPSTTQQPAIGSYDQESQNTASGNTARERTFSPNFEREVVNGVDGNIADNKINTPKLEEPVNTPETDEVPAVKVEETDLILNKRNFVRTYPVALNDVEREKGGGFKLPLYTEFAVGYGQSYKRIEFSNNWATQFRFTAGLTKEVPGMLLSAGLAFRAEMPNNLSYVKVESSASSATKSYVSEYRGLYSVDFPLEAAGRFGRNGLGLFFVPGIQLGYTGNKSYYENNNLVSRKRESGAIEDAKTMTMECGLKYSYDISEHMMFTGSCTFDLVRPFQSAYYQGSSKDYPVTFFVGLRRNF